MLREQQDPTSANFRRWLTPEEFGARFGASPETLTRATQWLESQGFTVESTARGRGWIVFSGTAGQAQDAFRIEIRRYQAGGRLHFAPTRAPAMPAELAGVIRDVSGLDDFYLEPSRRFLPMYTSSNGTHSLSPGDIARIYDLSNYYMGFPDAQGIAVAGQSAIDLDDIRRFQSTFGLPQNDPQVLLVGDDPGKDLNGAMLEADADIEWAGGVARVANITYVYAKNVFDATQEIVDKNLAPILSFSYGLCEPDVPSPAAAAVRDLAQQANAQGITWIAASGDAGAATCDYANFPAFRGLAVSFPASLPEVTGVGGTEFNEGTTGGASYWCAQTSNFVSACGYIPEVAWNTPSSRSLLASGGGVSTLYPKPEWQTGLGVPDNGARNVPDLALAASPSHDPYIVFSGGKQYTAGGTSFAAPVFAGILALAGRLNGRTPITPPGFGNINPSLYAMAAHNASGNIFHDITSGDNKVPCRDGAPDCSDGWLGYSAGAGYDLVTGLGSLSAINFILDFHVATTTTLSISSPQVTEGSTVNVSGTVLGADGNVPPGTVALLGTQAANLDGAGKYAASLDLPPGSYTIVARYGGGLRYFASTSATVNVTVVAKPPSAPELSASTSGRDVPVSTALSWSQTQSKSASYDVYLGTTSPPPFWGRVQGSRCWPNLAPNTTYYWKVVARNSSGTAESAIGSFTTSGQPVYRFSRVAGFKDSYGFAGDGGPAAQALLRGPGALALDPAGNLYVADSGNYRVRRVTPDGNIGTVAGSGAAEFSGDGGPALNAGLGGYVSAIAVDNKGNLYIAVASDHRVRRVSPDGAISTIAGTGRAGVAGLTGPASEALLSGPNALAVDSAGNLYISDGGNNCVRQVSNGMISTFAGQCGSSPDLAAGDGGPATSAILNQPNAVAVDNEGNVYIAETRGIRKVSNGTISTMPFRANSLTTDAAGDLFITDSIGVVSRITNGILTVAAGSSGPQDCCELGDGGVATSTWLAHILGVVSDPAGRLYVTVGGRWSAVWAVAPFSGPWIPSVRPGGAANGASFAAGPVSPGSLATLVGGFGVSPADQPVGMPLPVMLSGLEVQAEGSVVPLLYVSAGQVNFQVPWELAGRPNAQVRAVLNGVPGPPQTLTLATYSPGIFMVNSEGQGAILDSSYRLVEPGNPVTAGSVVQIYCTGLGPVRNAPATGNPSSLTAVSPTITPPSVSIGGLQATVLFSGLAPGAVGEYQVNVQVPTGVGAGLAVPLTLTIGGVQSNTVTVAVR